MSKLDDLIDKCWIFKNNSTKKITEDQKEVLKRLYTDIKYNEEKHNICELPTAFGKTALLTTLAKMLTYNNDDRVAILVKTISQQKMYTEECKLPHAKGRANYTCPYLYYKKHHRFINTYIEDYNKDEKSCTVGPCTYESPKDGFICPFHVKAKQENSIKLTENEGETLNNKIYDKIYPCKYKYDLYETTQEQIAVYSYPMFDVLQYIKNDIECEPYDYILMDEAHSLPDKIEEDNTLRINISKDMQKHLTQHGLPIERYNTLSIMAYLQEIEDYYGKQLEDLKIDPVNPRQDKVEKAQRIESKIRKCISIRKLMKEQYENWNDILTENGNGYILEVFPLDISEYAYDYIFRKSTSTVLASATLINTENYLEEIGLKNIKKPKDVIKKPQMIPTSNRPIIDMSWNWISNWAFEKKEWNNEGAYKKRETILRNLEQRITKIANIHHFDKIIIHVQKDLTKNEYNLGYQIITRLQKNKKLKDRIIDTRCITKNKALEIFRESENKILLHHYIKEGDSFPYDDARVNIICQIPVFKYSNRELTLGDKGNRKHLIKRYAQFEQMWGRTTRRPDDWSITYILDGRFKGEFYPNMIDDYDDEGFKKSYKENFGYGLIMDEERLEELNEALEEIPLDKNMNELYGYIDYMRGWD